MELDIKDINDLVLTIRDHLFISDREAFRCLMSGIKEQLKERFRKEFGINISLYGGYNTIVAELNELLVISREELNKRFQDFRVADISSPANYCTSLKKFVDEGSFSRQRSGIPKALCYFSDPTDEFFTRLRCHRYGEALTAAYQLLYSQCVLSNSMRRSPELLRRVSEIINNMPGAGMYAPNGKFPHSAFRPFDGRSVFPAYHLVPIPQSITAKLVGAGSQYGLIVDRTTYLVGVIKRDDSANKILIFGHPGDKQVIADNLAQVLESPVTVDDITVLAGAKINERYSDASATDTNTADVVYNLLAQSFDEAVDIRLKQSNLHNFAALFFESARHSGAHRCLINKFNKAIFNTKPFMDIGKKWGNGKGADSENTARELIADFYGLANQQLFTARTYENSLAAYWQVMNGSADFMEDLQGLIGQLIFLNQLERLSLHSALPSPEREQLLSNLCQFSPTSELGNIEAVAEIRKYIIQQPRGLIDVPDDVKNQILAGVTNSIGKILPVAQQTILPNLTSFLQSCKKPEQLDYEESKKQCCSLLFKYFPRDLNFRRAYLQVIPGPIEVAKIDRELLNLLLTRVRAGNDPEQILRRAEQVEKCILKGTDQEQVKDEILELFGIQSGDDKQLEEIIARLWRKKHLQSSISTTINQFPPGPPPPGSLLSSGGNYPVSGNVQRSKQSPPASNFGDFPQSGTGPDSTTTLHPPTEKSGLLKRIATFLIKKARDFFKPELRREEEFREQMKRQEEQWHQVQNENRDIAIRRWTKVLSSSTTNSATKFESTSIPRSQSTFNITTDQVITDKTQRQQGLEQQKDFDEELEEAPFELTLKPNNL